MDGRVRPTSGSMCRQAVGEMGRTTSTFGRSKPMPYTSCPTSARSQVTTGVSEMMNGFSEVVRTMFHLPRNILSSSQFILLRITATKLACSEDGVRLESSSRLATLFTYLGGTHIGLPLKVCSKLQCAATVRI